MDDETTGRLPDDDTELTRVTPPDDATRVMPAAGEGADAGHARRRHRRDARDAGGEAPAGRRRPASPRSS